MSKKKRTCVMGDIATALLISCTTAQPVFALEEKTDAAQLDKATARQLEQLAADYYLANAWFEPMLQTYSGNNRFDDQFGMSISPAKQWIAICS